MLALNSVTVMLHQIIGFTIMDIIGWENYGQICWHSVSLQDIVLWI